MDSTQFPDLPKPVMREATIADEVSLTIHQENSHPVEIGDTDENSSNQASSIIQALQLVQVFYLLLAGITAAFFAIYNIVAFAVLVVAFTGYFGLFWYNFTSSVRTRENAIALAIRSFSVATVLAFSSVPASYNYQSSSYSYFTTSDYTLVNVYSEANCLTWMSVIHILLLFFSKPHILLLLVVSVIDWRWNGLFPSDN